MYRMNTIGVVIPCYNEEVNLKIVVETMPEFVDYLVIVDDCSIDRTREIARDLARMNSKISLIELEQNSGVGAAISAGYKHFSKLEISAVVVMAGDGQMDPNYLPQLLDPVVTGLVDFSKSNRLFHDLSRIDIPRLRYLGNFILSFATKIATGYWHVSDAQSGYTVINSRALEMLDWDSMYPRYGQPNDLLAMLNAYDFKVIDIHTPPRYNVGEVSTLKIRKTLLTIPKILWKRFLWRLWVKYTVRSTHPLILLYFLGFFMGTIFWLFAFRISVSIVEYGTAPIISSIALMFAGTLSLLSFGFAMWMDYDFNRHLHAKIDNI